MARKRKPAPVPRKLKASWSLEAADQLREDMGYGRRRYIDVVTRVAAIDAGKPDPGEFEILPSIEEEMVSKMADEMTREIDTEVKKMAVKRARGVRKQGRSSKCRARRK